MGRPAVAVRADSGLLCQSAPGGPTRTETLINAGRRLNELRHRILRQATSASVYERVEIVVK
jgi:hypothetical protein